VPTKFARLTSNSHPIIRAAAALLLLAGAVCGQFLVLTPEPTAQDIAAKYVEAIGGAAQVAKVETMRIQGRMRFGTEAFTSFTVTAKRPDRFRMELTAGPDRIVQAYNGSAGWQSVSGLHNQPATPLEGDSLLYLRDQAANAIGGPLVDMEKRRNRAELVGHEAVNGIDCFKLKLTLATGNSRVMFIDASSFLVVQEELPAVLNSQAATIQQSVGNYRRFGPVLVPCLFVTRPKGGEDTQRIEIDQVEINPRVDDSIFQLPRLAACRNTGFSLFSKGGFQPDSACGTGAWSFVHFPLGVPPGGTANPGCSRLLAGLRTTPPPTSRSFDPQDIAFARLEAAFRRDRASACERVFSRRARASTI
jgi:hypothetical protein